MKTALLVLALAFASTSHAKSLSVSCQDSEGRTVALESELVNVAQPQQIKSLVVNGQEVTRYNDVTSLPLYNSGVIKLAINFGYNSVKMTLQDCDDSFKAQGSGQLTRYVGGFAGTLPSDLKCSCELK